MSLRGDFLERKFEVFERIFWRENLKCLRIFFGEKILDV